MSDIDTVKYNAVQLDRIFAEAVGKEKSTQQMSTQFCLNPAALRYVAPKPGSIDPVAMVAASRAQIDAARGLQGTPARQGGGEGNHPSGGLARSSSSDAIGSSHGAQSPLVGTGRTLTGGRPGTQSDPSLITEDVLSLMHLSNRSPKDKYLEPVLSSHAVGWNLEHAPRILRQNAKWRRPKGTCDVTTYATAYYTLYGTTPYSRPINKEGAAS